MTKSVLIVSPSGAVAAAIEKSIAADPDIRIERKATTLSGMNGHAAAAASRFDLILFETHPEVGSDLEAIRTMAANRGPGTRLVALADSEITLSEVRLLTAAGADEVLPFAGEGIHKRASRARQEEPAVAPHRHGRIIAVVQARGGIGSTTVAVNLADQLVRGAGLARKAVRPKVALVDLDLQFGSVGTLLNLEEQDTLHQLALDGTVPDGHFLAQSMPVLDSGLAVLAAPAKFAPLESLRADQVAAILDSLRASHDYVVVDLPRALVGWIEPVVERTDELLVVTDISVASVRHCRRLIDFFIQDNPALPVELVVNHQRKPLMASRLQREVTKVLERPLKHWLPHDARAADAAGGRGEPLSRVAPRSSLGRAMTRLACSARTSLSATAPANLS
jgi:Flp pilus assembly CpaE family ATPase